jgi:hypothetical protein
MFRKTLAALLLAAALLTAGASVPGPDRECSPCLPHWGGWLLTEHNHD